MLNQNPTSNVLIVDDDRSIRAALRTFLASNGFAIVETARGEEALEYVQAMEFDAVLLDIEMPAMNGIEALRLMREERPRLPIIVMSVMDGEESKVEALDAGADDYCTKPLRLRELAARLRSAVRRSRILNDDHYEAAIAIGNVLLDPERHRVEKGGRLVRLTPRQFQLLHYLMARAGRSIAHAKLLRSIWGSAHANQVEYLRTLVRQIRIRIEEDPANPKYLLTESGVGYRFIGSTEIHEL